MDTNYLQSDFYHWIGDGKRVVSYHEAGHAVAAWFAAVDIHYISIMDESGRVDDQHYNQAKCLGAVRTARREEFNLKRLLESNSGVVNRNGSLTPFIKFYAEDIEKYIQREILISLAGPVSEVAYVGGDILKRPCSFSKVSPGSDREHVNGFLDLFCASREGACRDEMLTQMIKNTELLVAQHWDKIEKIASILEREYVIERYQVEKIIGCNRINRVPMFFKSDGLSK